jgi:hypothetical protein
LAQTEPLKRGRYRCGEERGGDTTGRSNRRRESRKGQFVAAITEGQTLPCIFGSFIIYVTV